MSGVILSAVISLALIAIVSAIIISVVSKKFAVEENPLVGAIETNLPGANCGGCGLPGCHGFALALAESKDVVKLKCPVGGNDVLLKLSEVLGIEVNTTEPLIAVLRCQGSRENAPDKIIYDGAKSCLIAHESGAGQSGCAYGCLGLGDCVSVCQFEALGLNPETGLPIVDIEKCTSCGACVTACPRNLFELRPKGKDNMRIYVACMNEEKGAEAKKNCKTACIGCSKCTKVVTTDLIKIQNFLSYISPDFDPNNKGFDIAKSCPTHAIIALNIPTSTTEEKGNA